MEEGMTPEEKAVVMQFMGQTYGEMHKQDQNIIGNAGNLQPSSHVMKNIFEQTAHIPTVQEQRRQHPPSQHQQPDQPEQSIQQVTPEQAAAELQQAPSPSREIPPDPAPIQIYDDLSADDSNNQMELDLSEPTVADKLLDLLKEQNLLLKEISLKLDNGKKTTRGRKQR